jgi:transposase InsO family protein
MSYSNNPLLPKARIWAVNLVLVDGLSISQAAQRAAIHRSTLWRWLQRWEQLRFDARHKYLPTISSRPHTFGRAVDEIVVERIRYYRIKYGRCAAIVHAYCLQEGTVVSLSTVRRVLRRLGLVVRRRWQRYRAPTPRPVADAPGKLVQTDTVHLWHGSHFTKTYLYTMVDVYSRWAYAEHHRHISQELSYQFLKRGEAYAGFHFQTIQSDNGAEFGKWFEDTMAANGTTVRHSRVRKPNDNAFIERFNRTVQEECISKYDPEQPPIDRKILTYLAHYNDERLHLGLQCKTPASMLQR